MRKSCRRIVPFVLPILAFLTSAELAGAATQSAPRAASVPGFTHVRSLGGIHEYRLDANGLGVLVKPDHSAPVVTFQVTYLVGSRNEVTGTTGATHLLEHLMFKGSEKFNHAAGTGLNQYLERVGANYNATTWMDRTNYFATVGRDHVDGYVAIEADRMRNLWLRDTDRASEMTVVRNEYERGENDPANALEKEVDAIAFLAHPYHHATIGWRSDIENVPIEKLRAFYDTFYWPDNAVVTVVGDLEPAQALPLVQKYYGSLPRAPQPIPKVYTEEPEQTGPRRATVKRAGQLGNVIIAHKVPQATHADLPALDVLGLILSKGKDSRLYRALVDSALASRAEAGVHPTHDPGQFMTRVALGPGATHERVEQIVLAEFERLKTGGVTAPEVNKAIRQFRADQAYGRDGTARVASELNEWIAAGDWTLFVTYADKVGQVTPADVQRVARTYLDEDQSTTGWFVPITKKN